MKSGAGQAFFEHIEQRFERSNICGQVQVLSDEPPAAFIVTVEHGFLHYSEGTAVNPPSTIRMRENVLRDLVAKQHVFDSRVVEFSSRLTFSGRVDLCAFVLDLVKTPSLDVTALLESANERAKRNRVDAVESVHAPDKDVVQAAMHDFRPILMRGILANWQVESWRPDDVRKAFGKFRLASYESQTIDALIAETPASTKGASGNLRTYSTGVGLPGAMWAHFPMPTLLKEVGVGGFPQLWIGRSQDGTIPVTPVHCDAMHGFLTQVFGKKRIVLYSPEQSDFLYAKKAFNFYRCCWVETSNPNYDSFPRFRDARPIELVLEPGETLLIPAGWYHEVFVVDPVMSISFPMQN